MNIVPSIELIPAKYGVGTLLAQVPMDGSGDFSVTRATAVATRYNSAGLIETIASGIPRLDYYTSSGTPGCPALLVEPAATNFAPNVRYLSINDLGPGGPTITTGSTDFLAPDNSSGSITKYVGGAASGSQYAYYTGFSPTVSASGVHTLSMFVKAGTTNPLNFCALTFLNYTGASGTATSYFSLASGTAFTPGASIQDYGNGWYRLITAPYTMASGDLTGNVLFSFASSSGSTSFVASGALNLTAYTWGAQMEAGSVPTSYISTTTGSVTRAADVINKTSVSGLIGQTEGTLYAEFEIRNESTTRRLLALSDGTQSNRVFLYYTSNALRAQIQATDISLGNPAAGYHKVAFAYQQSGVSGTLFASLDGGAVVSGTTAGTFPSALNAVFIGKREDSDTTQQWNARIRSAAIYKTRLPNYLLESATSQIQSYSALASSLSYTVV
jgi:hypothetical protein